MADQTKTDEGINTELNKIEKLIMDQYKDKLGKALNKQVTTAQKTYLESFTADTKNEKKVMLAKLSDHVKRITTFITNQNTKLKNTNKGFVKRRTPLF